MQPQAAPGPQSNGPVMAEWTRGTSGVQSGLSIGFAADLDADGQRTKPVPGAPPVQQVNKDTQVQAQDANTKGMEGTPHVDKRYPPSQSLGPAEKDRQKEDGMASRYATLDGGEPNEENKDEEGTVVARKAMSSANGPDSLSAISKAGRESHPEVAAAGYNSKLNDAQVRDSMNQVKPTESLSSAAAGMFHGSYAAAIATAASLVSQNTGRAAMMNKSLSSEIPIDTNEALHALTNVPSPANNPQLGTASHNQVNAKSPRFADWPGTAVGISQGRPSRIGQLQHQMQNSSNSGNHQQRISSAQIPPKNKSFSSASKKHPMRPPPNASIARMNVALPTGSSSKAGGIQINLDQLAHTAEDAVSTVQPDAGEFLEVACDAVSKASGEAHGDDHKDEIDFTESRVVQTPAEEPQIGHATTAQPRVQPMQLSRDSQPATAPQPLRLAEAQAKSASPGHQAGMRRITRSMAKRQKK